MPRRGLVTREPGFPAETVAKEAISAYVRVAGQEWQQQPVRGDLQLPPAVTVSVFLGHSTSQECQATFADLTIGKPKEE